MPILTTLGAACARAWGFTSGLLKDPYFNLTTLLLPGNGTNGAQNNTFLDSSTNNFTITRNPTSGPNAPTQGTFSPFSQTGWGNYFDGSSYLSVSGGVTNNATNDITLEFWSFYTGSYSNYATAFDSRTSPSFTNGFAIEAAVTTGYWTMNFTVQDILTSTPVAKNSWQHIAITRSSNTFRFFVNGVLQGSVSSTNNLSSTANVIGAAYNAGSKWPGYISNLRVIKGSIPTAYQTSSTTVGTSVFTPPTSPLTAVSGTSLLTCQSNRFIDNSSNAFAITTSGSPSVVAFSPFAPTAAYTTAAVGGSGYFDGTGDYLTVASPTTNLIEWYTSSVDFTVEAWVYPISLTNFSTGSNPVLCGNFNQAGTDYWSFGPLSSGTVRLRYFNGAGVSVDSTETVKALQWNHVAFTKTSSGVSIFVNGVGTTAVAISGTPQSSTGTPFSIASNLGVAMNAYVSNLRVVKGTAVYSGATYTVPTAPPTAITNTSLLLNFTNAGITDATAKNDLETVGNAQISTSVSKFGGGSIAFDGTGDYLTVPDNVAFDVGSGDWTIELWANFNSVSGEKGLVSHFTAGTPNAGYTLRLSTSNSPSGLRLVCSGSSDVVLQAAWTPVVSTWYHIAAVRNGGTLYIYVDGQQIGSTSIAITIGNPSALFAVGTAQTVASSDFNGYIDDLRFTKFARYTTGTGANAGKMVFNGTNTLALPTAPFPVQ